MQYVRDIIGEGTVDVAQQDIIAWKFYVMITRLLGKDLGYGFEI